MSSSSVLRRLLPGLLSLLVLAAARAPLAAQGSGMDMVFVVDTSSEMREHDASGSRLELLHALVDLSRGHGPQRLGVLSLSRKEGSSADPVVLPLTTLPDDLASVWAVLESKVRPVFDGSLGDDGDALPIIDTFRRLEPMLSGREASVPLWIVLLTNGDADPLGNNSGQAVTPEVMARAEENARNPKRDDIKAAAKQLIPELVPPMLGRLGDRVVLTIVNVQTVVNREPVLDRLAEAQPAGPREVLDLDGTNLREVAVRAIAQAPLPERPGGVLTQLLSGAETQSFRIYQGTRSAQVLLQAGHGDFDVHLNKDGRELTLPTSGGTGPVRSLWLVDPPPAPGEYELVVDNKGGNLNLDARVEFELDLSLDVDPPKGGTYALGGRQALAFRLTDSGGNVVADEELLAGGLVRVQWKDPAGNPPAEETAPPVPFEARSSYGPDSVTDGARDFGWSIDVALLPNGSGGYDWRHPTVSGSTSSEFSLPKLAFELTGGSGDWEAEGAGGSLSFATDWVSGTVEQDATMRLDVQLLGMESVDVDLRFVPSAAFADALASGKTAATLAIDGKPIGTEPTTVTFREGTPGAITVELAKNGFGPFSGDVGELVATVSADQAGRTSTRVGMDLGPTVGVMTLVALLALLALLALVWLLVKKMQRKRAWAALLAGLDDDAVLYFEDDEAGAVAG